MIRIRACRAGLTLAALVVGFAPPAVAGPKSVPQYSIEDFLATTLMRGADFSPDGRKILVSSDRSGVFNAYAIPVTGGEPVQLTRSATNAIIARSWYPHDERFLYESDQGGNELTHLYMQTPGGQSRDVTPGEKLKASFIGWAHDERSFFIVTNERDARFFDLYEVDPESFTRTLVYQDSTGLQVSAISRDKRYLALSETITTHDANVHLYDCRTKELRLLTPHTGEVDWQAVEFAPNGRTLFLTSDEGEQFSYLVEHEIATGQRQVAAKPGWDILAAAFSHSGKYLVIAINNDSRTEVRLFEMPDMKPVALPEVPAGDITGIRIADDDTRMAFYLSGSRWPANLYVSDIGGGKAKQLTQNLSPKIDPEHLVDGQVVRFLAPDAIGIPGILYKPHAASTERKCPALVWVHGGPGDQSRLGYSPPIQFLVNHGYAIYAINNRGSSGYGKTFYAMDDRKHGDADLNDCVSSKQMLTETGWVDGQRIGIIGGSYGGYMVLAALAFRPQEFVVGIDLFGVSNWLRTLESIPPYWEAIRKSLYTELGDPAVDAEALRAKSPLFHAKNIVRPLLVLQGKNDPRVLQVESDEIVAAAKANGVPVEYIVFDDEGHGFRKKKNQQRGYQAVLDFCNTHLAAPKQ